MKKSQLQDKEVDELLVLLDKVFIKIEKDLKELDKLEEKRKRIELLKKVPLNQAIFDRQCTFIQRLDFVVCCVCCKAFYYGVENSLSNTYSVWSVALDDTEVIGDYVYFLFHPPCRELFNLTPWIYL